MEIVGGTLGYVAKAEPSTGPRTIGQRISALRSERGVTQAELSKASGVAQGLISKFEKEEQQPNVESAKKLAKAFRVTLDELCGMHEATGPEIVRSRIGNLTKAEERLVLAYRHDDRIKNVVKTLLREFGTAGDDE